MPIRPEFRWLYPIDWPQLSALVRFRRAKGACQCCGRPHGQIVCVLSDGRWWDGARKVWRDSAGRVLRSSPTAAEASSLRTTRVILAAAHRDHDPTNNRLSNLIALCQRCHMAHDRLEHRRRRLITLFRRKALGDLFLGRY